MIQQKLSRGMVSVRIFRESGSAAPLGINTARLEALAAAALEWKERLRLDGAVTPTALLMLPGVLDDGNSAGASEEFKRTAAAALEAALEGLNRMRKAEGEALRAELTGRLALLRSIASELHRETAGIEEALRQRLTEKIAQMNLAVDVQDERFLKELLFYADKSDVTEELTRLESHFEQFDGFLAGEAGGGRSMDFLIQEMFREITTLGNKAGTSAVSHRVVAFKAELEKMREQVQNVE